MYLPDNLDLFDQYDREQEREERMRKREALAWEHADDEYNSMWEE